MSTLLDRFCRYVKVETTANEDTEAYPSSPGQFDLGRMLTDELKSLHLDDVGMDEHGIVMATIPGNVDGAPTMAWLAHMDTSPEFTAKDVKPAVHENYDGNDIVLSGDKARVIRVAESPELAALKGKTIITTDGTTLLGADDKSGVAVIMTAAEHLMSHPELKHGPIRIVFTCDEEIGRGTDKLDLKKIDATVAYTLDGEDQGNLECETFSADQAIITIAGKNIHPGFAKDRMVNALRVAATFLSHMPSDTMSPESTEGREGFLHPYVIDGGVPEVRIKCLLRSFVTADLADQAKLLDTIAEKTRAAHPEAEIGIRIQKQYRNMIEALEKEPRANKLAQEAIRRAGLEPKLQSIRGGTDGSRLSEMGLPTPNLSVGMHNFHSPLEFACLEQMEKAVEVLVELAQLWGNEK
ncbi:MAG: peptidase T [Phycisphaerales bacterium]|nr:peptidase T [Phycisphaerales bacterium]